MTYAGFGLKVTLVVFIIAGATSVVLARNFPLGETSFAAVAVDAERVRVAGPIGRLTFGDAYFAVDALEIA